MKKNITKIAVTANNHQMKGEEVMKKNMLTGMVRTMFIALVAMFVLFAGAKARNVLAAEGSGGLPSRFPEAANEEGVLAYLIEKYPATRSQHLYKDDKFGTCWAHAAVALAEFYMISHNLSDANGPVDRTVNYSELQVFNFCYREGPDPYQGSTGDHISFEKKNDDEEKADKGTGEEEAGDKGTGDEESDEKKTKSKRDLKNLGGKYRYAGQSLMRGNGFTVDAGDAAYENMDIANDIGMPKEYARAYNVAALKSYYALNIKTNPEGVKKKIMENGAVGIRYFSDPKYLNEATNAVYTNEDHTINHAVVVVGWDDNYPAENFKKCPPTDGAWLVRNSHSTYTRMSEESYFWLSYCDKGLEADAYVFEMADRSQDNYDHMYCYDAQLHDSKTAKSAFAANVFRTVQDGEWLRAVQFDATMQVAGKTTIRIYTNLADEKDPQSGTLRAEATTFGEYLYKGSYTLRLESPVLLARGETFAIVIETENPIDRESDLVWKEQLTMDTTLHIGESFCFVNGSWEDLAYDTKGGKRGNLCIRALVSVQEGTLTRLAVNRKVAAAPQTLAVRTAEAVKVYEVYRNGVYRYLTNAATVRRLIGKGWGYRTAFFAEAAKDTQVYWIYNKKTGTYLYTTSRDEAVRAKRGGKKVGKAFFVNKTTGEKVFKVGKGSSYIYTTNRSRVRKLQQKGWKYVGVAWYAPRVA